jgi:hypothetical protein
MSDREELRDEAREERRREPEPAYRWEYVACNCVMVPVELPSNRCRYCNGQMVEVADGVFECEECAYEEYEQ